MKVKKTYSRKNQRKPVENAKRKVIDSPGPVFNISFHTHHNYVFNIINYSPSQRNPETSKSESSDVFDQLVNGPKYNVNKQSTTFGSSEHSRKFFSQRQDTATFYKSDAELSVSTDISNHLFKDSRDSDNYTPTWDIPAEYCKVKNKLVKIDKGGTVQLSKNKLKQVVTINQKSYNHIHKKYRVVKQKKVKTQVMSVPCTSSTPNRSNALGLFNKNTWPDKHVSPIMPLQCTPRKSISPEYMLATRQNQKVGNLNSTLSVSALIQGFGQFGLKTPLLKKMESIANSANAGQELFEYTSPVSIPVKYQSEGLDGGGSEQPGTNTPSIISEEEDSGDDKRFKEVENVEGSESEQLPCKNQSPSVVSVSNLDGSGCSSNTSLYRDQEHSSVNSDGKHHSSNMSSPIPEKEISNQYPEETDSRSSSLFSCKERNSIISSDSKLKSGNIEIERSENDCGNSDINCSLPSLEGNINQYRMSEVYKEDPEVSCLNDSNHQESPVKEIKRKSETKNTNSKTYKNDQAFSSLIESNFKTSSAVFKVCESQPLSDLELDTFNCENTMSSCKERMSTFSSDSRFKSGNIETENSENYCDNSDLNCSLPSLKGNINQYHMSEVYKEDPEVSLNDSNHQESPVKEIKRKSKRKDTNSKTYKNDLAFSSLIESNFKTSSTVLKKCESQPISDLELDTFNCENTGEIYKRPVRLCNENKKTAQYDMKGKCSLQPLATELNETMVKLNLEAGKKWRRSLLRQKQPEAMFDRRSTMSADTLVKLIKDSSILSGFTNDTTFSYNNTTRIIDSLLEDQKTRNSSLLVPPGSPGYNEMTFSRFANIHRRKRRNDMDEIPEEDQSPSESVLVQDQGNAIEHHSFENVTINQTDIYETPPILKMNPEALSAITDRKRSRRYQARSFGESSMMSAVGEQNDTEYEETNLYTSCCSKLEMEDDLQNLNEEYIGKLGFLLRCGQEGPVTFAEAFPDRVLNSGKKIGEGVFGEVFMLERPGMERSVIKIIPLEGSELVNGAAQKRFDEVLSELIITEELSVLRQNGSNFTSGFCQLIGKYYLQGQYPSQLLTMWNKFDKEKVSENQCPDMFGPDQQYLALELAHAGEAVESFSFHSPQQTLAVFLQTTFTLAVAESGAEFEHRDLHVGNVLVQKTSEKFVTFGLNGNKFQCPTKGTMTTIIDYTLSRIGFKGDVLYLDLETDPELFTAKGDYQFDIYRHMRADLDQDWRRHQPKTNVRWLHYLIDKFVNKIKYKQKKKAKIYRENMDILMGLKEIILDFYSATDLAQHLMESYSQTESLIKKLPINN